jgi:hypothetical protein
MVSRRPTKPMLAKSLDAFGSRARPRAADQNRPTARASAQSTVTAAILTVMVSARAADGYGRF